MHYIRAMSDDPDRSAAFYHYTSSKPIGYDDFMALAKKFHHVAREHFPGETEVFAMGGAMTSACETPSGGMRIESRSNFFAKGIDAFPRNLWENTELSRFIFRSSANEQILGMMDFQQEEVYNLTFILCPANPAIQRQIFPEWLPK